MRRVVSGSILSALWIIFVAVISVLFAVYSLTAFQVQTRIHSFSAEGHSYSVWNLERLRIRQQARQIELAPLEPQFRELQGKLLNARENLFLMQEKEWSLSARINSILYQIYGFVRQKDPTFKFPKEESTIENLAVLVAKVDQLGLKSAVEEVINEFTRLESEWVKMDASLYSVRESIKAREIEHNARLDELDKLRSQAEDFFEPDTKMSRADKNRILDFVSELDVLEKRFGFLRALTIVPNEMLLILLVLFMGMLGSSIYLTRMFFVDKQEQTLGFTISRHFLGALTAFMLFITVKAGVLIATEPRSGPQVGALNPFLLAFLGLIGGLISEQVVETVSKYGREWLSNRGLDRWRYACGVHQELQAQNKTVEQLSIFFEGRKTTVEAWLSETERVPPEAQSIISAWLNKPIRNLFSDVAGPVPRPAPGQ